MLQAISISRTDVVGGHLCSKRDPPPTPRCTWNVARIQCVGRNVLLRVTMQSAGQNPRTHVPMYPCAHVPMSPCPAVPLSRCLAVDVWVGVVADGIRQVVHDDGIWARAGGGGAPGRLRADPPRMLRHLGQGSASGRGRWRCCGTVQYSAA